MKLEDLVGSRLVKLNDYTMEVKKDDTLYVIDFDCDHGGCCGYAEITANLLVEDEDSKNNPIITNVEFNRDSDNDRYSDNVVITLFGEYKPMAEIKAEAGSGSGWCYGATVSVQCKALDMNEIIAEW